MSNLPTLPGCGQAATVRIEAYSPANGRLHGSLDASVYACERHAIEVVSTLYAAGLTGHRVPMAPDVERRCGEVHVFPAGVIAGGEQAGEGPHPAWCDRKDCVGRGEHRSRARDVDTGRPEALIVDVALVQGLCPGAGPVVSLTGVDGVGAAVPVVAHVLLSIGQARTLRYRLAQLIDAARGGAR